MMNSICPFFDTRLKHYQNFKYDVIPLLLLLLLLLSFG
jgi:hypothetical protein